MVQWSELRAFTERPGSIPGEEMRSPQAVWHGQEKKSLIIESEVTQSCPTLCNPTDCGPTRLLPSMEFSKQEYWSRLPFPSPGESSRSGYPALQVDALPSEPPGNPPNH